MKRKKININFLLKWFAFILCIMMISSCSINKKEFPIKSSIYKSSRLYGNWNIQSDTVYYISNGLNIPMFALKSKVGDSYYYSSFTKDGEYLKMKVITKEKIEVNNQMFYLVEHVCGNFGESIDFKEDYTIEYQKVSSNYDRRTYLVSYDPFFIEQFFFKSEVNNCFY